SRELVHARAHGLGGLDRVAGRRELDADRADRLAVQARLDAVVSRAELDAPDVLQPHERAARAFAQHDVAELLGRVVAALRNYGCRKLLAGRRRQLADLAGREL